MAIDIRSGDSGDAVRRWFQRLEGCVGRVDYAGGRDLFAPEVVAFGTKADVVAGLENLQALQWSGVWPNIRDFRFDLAQLHWGESDGLAWGVVPWMSTGYHEDGRTFPRPGRATIVFAIRGNQLLALHSHFSLFPGTPPRSFGPREN